MFTNDHVRDSNVKRSISRMDELLIFDGADWVNELLRETLLPGDPVYDDLKYHCRYLDFEHVRGRAQNDLHSIYWGRDFEKNDRNSDHIHDDGEIKHLMFRRIRWIKVELDLQSGAKEHHHTTDYTKHFTKFNNTFQLPNYAFPFILKSTHLQTTRQKDTPRTTFK